MTTPNIDDHLRRPVGDIGRRIGEEMATFHLPETLWTIERLAPQPTDHILEIGFGAGVAIQELLKHVTDGLVAGADFSDIMVEVARERNAAAIAERRADLRYGDVVALSFATAAFDKAFSMHSIYFWEEPVAALRELHRVLKPGGRLLITMLPKDLWKKNPLGSAQEFTNPGIPYHGSEVEALLREAGFSHTSIEADPTENAHKANYAVVGIK